MSFAPRRSRACVLVLSREGSRTAPRTLIIGAGMFGWQYGAAPIWRSACGNGLLASRPRKTPLDRALIPSSQIGPIAHNGRRWTYTPEIGSVPLRGPLRRKIWSAAQDHDPRRVVWK